MPIIRRISITEPTSSLVLNLERPSVLLAAVLVHSAAPDVRIHPSSLDPSEGNGTVELHFQQELAVGTSRLGLVWQGRLDDGNLTGKFPAVEEELCSHRLLLQDTIKSLVPTRTRTPLPSSSP